MLARMLWLLACDSPEPTCADAVPAAQETAVPGDTIVLSGGGGAWRWEVSAGTLSAETGESVTWTLPDDIAAFGPEELAWSATPEDGTCGERVDGVVIADWEPGQRTVVVYNPSIAGSQDVAERYARFRQVDVLCPIASPDSTVLDGDAFPAWVEALEACIPGPRTQYVVPVYGVPYKVSNRIRSWASGSIVDVSLDALLVLGTDAIDATTVRDNPLYLHGDSPAGAYDDYVPIGELRSEQDEPWYVVARIDGADADAAIDLVARTEAAQQLADDGLLDGTVYVDGRYGDDPPATDFPGSYESGEWDMWGTRALFEADGRYPVVWDGNEAEFGEAPAPETCPEALYYAGWYSFYNYNDAFAWQPGAIGMHLDSCSACNLREGTWTAMALQRGITATGGAVDEPYVAGMPSYDQLFRYLLQGATFGEAAYESTQMSLWMVVFVGDPLYRPYPDASP
jgi:uncharacterized protein (TIGR03790 family)